MCWVGKGGVNKNHCVNWTYIMVTKTEMNNESFMQSLQCLA